MTSRFFWHVIAPAVFLAALALSLFGCGKSDTGNPASVAARPPFTVPVLVAGKSMLPTFGDGELVTLEICPFSALRGNDTVVYWHDGIREYIHHRLDGRDDTGRWVTRGDNNGNIDRGHMTSDEFVGRTHKLAFP